VAIYNRDSNKNNFKISKEEEIKSQMSYSLAGKISVGGIN
jgi:hypothetical protein